MLQLVRRLLTKTFWFRVLQITLAVALLSADKAGQFLVWLWRLVEPELPWLCRLVVTGFALGTALTLAMSVTLRYASLLDTQPAWPLVFTIWGLGVMLIAFCGLGWMILRLANTPALTGLSSLRTAPAANTGRQDDRFAGPIYSGKNTPKPKGNPSAKTSDFQVWSEDREYLNEVAAGLRSQEIDEERIQEVIREYGRTGENV